MPCLVVNTPARAFLPSGMTKNGTQAVGAGFADITSWTADAATYPGSTVDSNTSLVAQSSKASATLTASITVTGSGSSFNYAVRILVNGVVVATGSNVAGNGGTITVPCSTTAAINAGDLVKVQITGPGSFGTVASGATSFLTIT